MRVRVLSFHAGYACRHRGACCASGWPIVVEHAERTAIERAIDSGALAPAQATAGVFHPSSAPHGPALLASTGPRCVFRETHPGGGCRIHRAMGHAALPLACRQFPRQSVRDPRGVSVTLSHYCPTALDQLVRAADSIMIVSDAAGFPADAEYVGLEADAALPPLLQPDRAMDWESWWLFEALSVHLIETADAPLDRLRLAVEFTRAWAVDQGTLSDHVRESFTRALHARVTPAAPPDSLIADALDAVPGDWRHTAEKAIPETASAAVSDAVMRRYLAAHAFANWAAYLGEGLRTWLRSVETAACLITRTGDAGQADLILRHLADTSALMKRWSHAERTRAITTTA